MFFATNEDGYIVAADNEFLDDLNCESIYDAAVLLKNGLLTIDELESRITYLNKNNLFEKDHLNSVLGNIYLYTLHPIGFIADKDISDSDKLSSLTELIDSDQKEFEEAKAVYTDDIKQEEAPKVEESEVILLDVNQEEQELELIESSEKIKPETKEYSDGEHTLESVENISSSIKNQDQNTDIKTDDDDSSGKEDFILKASGLAGAGAIAYSLDNDDRADGIEVEEDEPSKEDVSVLDSIELLEEPEESESEEGEESKLDEQKDNLLEIKDDDILTEADKEDELDADEQLFELKEGESESLEETKEEDSVSDSLELIDDETEDEAEETKESESYDHIADTTSDTSEDKEPVEESPDNTDELPETAEYESSLDIKELAEIIGISEKEYLNFIKEFQAEAADLESDIRSNDFIKSKDAIANLKEASLLLHLPHITEKLNELSNVTSDEKEETIDQLINMIAGIGKTELSQTSYIADTEYQDAKLDSGDSLGIKTDAPEESIDVIDERDDGSIKDETDAKNDISTEIDLSNIMPIPFDFSINEAAEDLALPASLVSEFVVDFINQAKENLPVLQNAYESRDLDTIQKTAHMLKGASSNLRITAIADTLYNLQFNDSLSKVPELLKRFSGQLKALSIQMDQE